MSESAGNALTAEERERVVVERYKAGRKLSEIEQEAGVARSTLYYILDKHGIRANRSNRRAAILSDATLKDLWDLITHQDQSIQELTAALGDLPKQVEENRRRIEELEAQVRDLGGAP